LDNVDTWTGSKTTENSGDPVVQAPSTVQATEDDPEHYVKSVQAETMARFNARYAFTEIGNESRVPAIVEFDASGNFACRRRLSDFHTSISCTQRNVVPVFRDEQIKYVMASRWWLGDPKHRWHRSILLAPPGSPVSLGDHDYNLWRGFAVEPKQGDWSRNEEHIHRIICDGNDDQFRWLLNWMAALVQKPGQHAWIAPLLVGGQGIGKGHLVDYTLSRLFNRRQYAHLGNADELTGQFTEHLSARVLVYADESFWGNSSAADALKRYITEDTVMIHPKHFPRYEEPSNLHIIIASNSERPLPVERDDRRLAVFQASEARKNDQVYFRGLREELDHGGRAAMLHELLQMQVDDDWLRQPPASAAKVRMKVDSLDPIDLFFQEVLQDAGSWEPCVVRDDFHQRFLGWYHLHHYPGPTPARELLGNRLTTMFRRGGKPEYPAYRKVMVKEGRKSLRKNAWLFPSLDECRTVFEAATGTTPTWTPPDHEERESQK
jgi:hypothetical protein